MSQYALYLAKKRSGQKVAFLPISNDHNGYELDRLFGIKKPSIANTLAARAAYFFFWSNKLKFLPGRRPLSKLLKLERYVENFDYKFQAKALATTAGTRYLFGGWHTQKYFESISDEIKNIFVFPEVVDSVNRQILVRISRNTSVSIHIRRGDYNNHINSSMFGSVCNADFYRRALAEIQKRIPEFLLVVFSNDHSWARENIQYENSVFVDWNGGRNSWIDMYLMTNCDHNIICNSTFSWWGAWLNSNPDKIVICPDRFISTDYETQVFPESWIKIDTGQTVPEIHE